MVASNEYENDPGASTFDMLIKDYVSVPVRANVVRCGVEFATEGSRKTNGKPMTDNDLFHALQKAERENGRTTSKCGALSLMLNRTTGY